jgi:multiple antibiotic resistance protein
MSALAIRAFLTLFVLLDPIGLAPLFLGLAGNRSAAERARIAKRAVLVAGGVLLLFGIAGSWLLTNLGISLDAFRVAGGVLLFRIAVDMVFAQLERETPEEATEARARPDITVFPMAIPLIAGPGALACIMILAGEARAFTWGLPMVLGVCALDLALVFAGLHMASRIARLLGQTGINVVSRVLGVLLAALAVQYVADGVRGLLSAR